MGEYPLDAPPMTFETEGFWVAAPEAASELIAQRGLHVMGGLHALEHALIGIFPLLALADRWDLGGISFAHHPQVNGPAVFVYDGYPGGAGLCRKGYELFERLLQATSSLVKDCPCESGCPGCIQSPKCGNGNRPLDKEAALLLMEVLSGGVAVAPKRRAQPRPRVRTGQPASEPMEKPGRLVFDLETQKLADEVGGWGNISRMKLALAVAWDLDSGRWRVYFEKDAGALVDDLLEAKEVIGFNVRRFDIEVLRPYTRKDLSRVRIVDLLEVVKERLGFRLSLASLAEANFGESKSADGVQSVQWYREGRLDLIEKYCRKDVELTGRLYLKGIEEGHVLFTDKRSNRLRMEVNGWRTG